MSLRDSYFAGDVEDDVTHFTSKLTRKRVLVFPPVNNYRRFLIHQLVQERFSDLLHTFSIGQGDARRTVVCFKSDVIRDPKTMEVEERSPVMTPEHNIRQRQVKSVPTVEIYRPPAARRAIKEEQPVSEQEQAAADSNAVRSVRQKRPDRAVYVPRHRRDAAEPESCFQTRDSPHQTTSRDRTPKRMSSSEGTKSLRTKMENQETLLEDEKSADTDHSFDNEIVRKMSNDDEHYKIKDDKEEVVSSTPAKNNTMETIFKETTNTIDQIEVEISEFRDGRNSESEENRKDNEKPDGEKNINDRENRKNKIVRNVDKVLVISDKVVEPVKTEKKDEEEKKEVPIIPMTPPEKKVKKIERPKSKPAPPPSPAIKINRDECDWDSLFDDNGDCLDPTLIEELTTAVGEVMIEQPKNNYKLYTRPVEVSNDEFAHVIEIYNFPSEFKTSDLAAVFSPFKNGGFELKWVDDTHCLGVFSSALIAAEVLASDHPFVKTRPLSEATALSKTKAKRSSEFLQPYKSRPETCAALARRLVTGALGVKLATARQEREHEKIVLREAKERRRLANKQREDAWEGVIAQK